MAKKESGLVENQEVEVVETAQPTQEVVLNGVPVKQEDPGHATRAYRK
jgi:hypothetical protein